MAVYEILDYVLSDYLGEYLMQYGQITNAPPWYEIGECDIGPKRLYIHFQQIGNRQEKLPR